MLPFTLKSRYVPSGLHCATGYNRTANLPNLTNSYVVFIRQLWVIRGSNKKD